MNKVHGLLNSVFNNKARTMGMRTNQNIILMACLGLSLQACCNLKPPELTLPGEQDESIRLGRYDAVGKKASSFDHGTTCIRNFLAGHWLEKQEKEGEGARSLLDCILTIWKFTRHFNYQATPKYMSSMKHKSRARSEFDGSISSMIWLH